jgi:hypothetical protein
LTIFGRQNLGGQFFIYTLNFFEFISMLARQKKAKQLAPVFIALPAQETEP